jgi:thiamine-phosphate pyrophosphorylase
MPTELAARLHGLYAITPDWADTPRLLAVSEAVLAAGCRLLQYRNKSGDDKLRREQALGLRRLTRRFDALLIVNDDLDLAEACDADGVHLGDQDAALSAARARLGPERVLGASCYQDPVLAGEAARAGADYVAFGSFFPSPSKPQARRASPDLLAAGKARSNLPVCAIGGITPDDALPLMRAGADMVAVISALYTAADPGQAARDFITLIQKTTEEHS